MVSRSARLHRCGNFERKLGQVVSLKNVSDSSNMVANADDCSAYINVRSPVKLVEQISVQQHLCAFTMELCKCGVSVELCGLQHVGFEDKSHGQCP